MRMPTGAFAIAQARDNGMRPADPVIVSLVGMLPEESNPVVVVHEKRHDWRFMLGLKCYVFVNPASQFVQETLLALARNVECMWLWDVERKRGMDLWPIWRGLNVPEVHGYCALEERRDAIFERWSSVRWLCIDNQRFEGTA